MTQIDFLDQLGRELDGAAGRLIRQRRTVRLRTLLAPAAGVAAALALAVTLWPGAPADPEREVASAPAAKTPADVLAVLRRPESEADRGEAAREGREALTRSLGADATFRLVSTLPDGTGVVVGAAEATVCLHYPQGRGAGGGACWSAADVSGGLAHGAVGDRYHGLAPDGATQAVVTTLEDERTAEVRGNFFEMTIDDPGLVVTVVLRDAQGGVVAQDLRGRATVPLLPVPDETLAKARVLAGGPAPEPAGHPVGPSLDELRAVAAEIAGILPYPPGMGDDFDWSTVSRDPQDMGSINQRFPVQALLEYRAMCMWQRYWLAAVQAGDQAVARQAVAVLETTPRWPTLRDDRPEDTVEGFAAAAAQGQVKPIAVHVGANCGLKPPTRRP